MIKFDMIYAKDLPMVVREEGVVVIDLRDKKEYDQMHWENAYNLPIEETEDYTKLLSKNKYYVLYCDHGGSSMMLARYLGRRGYAVGTIMGGFATLKNWIS